MADISTGRAGTTSASSPADGQLFENESRGWAGWIAFAATLAALIGIIHVMNGLTALFNDDYYLVTEEKLIINIDYTAWGWAHLLFGILAIAVGVGISKRQLWARAVGVVFAIFSIVLHMAQLNAHPGWSTIVIALDAVFIWALTVHGAEMGPTRPGGTRPMWDSPYGPS